MENRLKELEERINVLDDKLIKQYEINSKLIEFLKEIGDMENLSVYNSVNKLKELNYKFNLH